MTVKIKCERNFICFSKKLNTIETHAVYYYLSNL